MLNCVHQFADNYMIAFEITRKRIILGHKSDKNNDKILAAALTQAQPKNIVFYMLTQ